MIITSARKLATKLAAENPDHHFATNIADNIVGHAKPKNTTPYEYAPLIGLTLSGEWAPMPQVLVDGQPVVTRWIPVP